MLYLSHHLIGILPAAEVARFLLQDLATWAIFSPLAVAVLGKMGDGEGDTRAGRVPGKGLPWPRGSSRLGRSTS